MRQLSLILGHVVVVVVAIVVLVDLLPLMLKGFLLSLSLYLSLTLDNG